MDQDTRAKAIQAAYDVVAADAGSDFVYISSLRRADTYGENYEILSEGTGPLGAIADCWVDFEGIVDAVADVLGCGSGAPEVMESWREDPENEADNEALREAPDACFYFASVNGPTSGIVARRLTDLFGRDATARAQRFAKGVV